MKLKKVLALIMVATMVVAPMTVFAEDEINEGEANGTIEGAGDIEGWVDNEQFCVTLPTTSEDDLQFVIDPQGLKGAVDEENGGDGTLGSGETKGTIIFGENAKVTLVNKSSYAVGFDVNVSLETNDKDLNVVALDGIETDAKRNIYIAAQPLNADGEVIENEDLALEATGKEGVVGNVDFAYALEDANDQYEVSGSTGAYSYSLKDGAADFDEVSFGFTGLVNSKADWSAYASEEDDKLTMTLEVSYSVEKLGCEYADAEQNENVHGLLVASEAPKVKAAPSAPTTANVNVTSPTEFTNVISGISLGKGDLAATGISTIKLAGTAIKAATTVPTTGSTTVTYMYDADAETLTLYGNKFTKADTEYALIITFNDADATVCTITLNSVATELGD